MSVLFYFLIHQHRLDYCQQKCERGQDIRNIQKKKTLTVANQQKFLVFLENFFSLFSQFPGFFPFNTMVVSEKQTDQPITALDAGESLKKQPEPVRSFRLESKVKTICYTH